MPSTALPTDPAPQPDPSTRQTWSTRKLRLALAFTFGGLLALMLMAMVSAFQALNRLHQAEEEVRLALAARSQAVSTVLLSTNVYTDNVEQYVLSGPNEEPDLAVAQIAQRAKQIEALLEQYPGEDAPADRDFLRAIKQQLNEGQTLIDSMVDMQPQERRLLAPQLLRERVLPGHVQVLETSRKVIISDGQRLGEADKGLLAQFDGVQLRLTRLLVIALTAGLFLVVGSMMYIFRLERQAQARYLELARSRAGLEQLSARLVDAQETERRSISRELHDEVGQSLGTMLIDLGRLSSLVPPNDPEIAGQLAAIKKTAENTVGTVRNIALLLRPSMLDDLGLVPALEWQGREMSRRGQLEVEVASENVSEDLSDEYKICIYRLVQEALNNAARHASAKNAKVTVTQGAASIMVRVWDDGLGFEYPRMRGLGLMGMEERVKRFGGTLAVQSQPGDGTLVIAEIPLHASSAAKSA